MDQRKSSHREAVSPVQCAATAPVPSHVDLRASEARAHIRTPKFSTAIAAMHSSCVRAQGPIVET